MIAALPCLILTHIGFQAVPLTSHCGPVVATCSSSAQEPEAPKQDPEAEKEKPEKKKFARLTSPNKKVVQAGLRALEKGKKQEDVDAGVETLLGVGEAAVPMCLQAVARMEKADRIAPLWQTLDQILVDDDLKLAWSILRKKEPDAIKVYLVRRYADSERKDAGKFLAPLVKSESAGVAYESARGLVLRGDKEALGIIEQHVSSRWLKEAGTFRSDFASVKREPLSSSVTQWLQRKRLKEKLAGLRMFELFGIEEHARLVAPFLSESDTSLRLAAINACRVVIAKEEPLERPSMTEIIERAEAWKAKL